MKFIPAIAVAVTISGCTSINVRSVAPSENLREVCIVDNPKVTVADFVAVLRDGFSRNNIDTTVVSASRANACDVTLT